MNGNKHVPHCEVDQESEEVLEEGYEEEDEEELVGGLPFGSP